MRHFWVSSPLYTVPQLDPRRWYRLAAWACESKGMNKFRESSGKHILFCSLSLTAIVRYCGYANTPCRSSLIAPREHHRYIRILLPTLGVQSAYTLFPGATNHCHERYRTTWDDADETTPYRYPCTQDWETLSPICVGYSALQFPLNRLGNSIWWCSGFSGHTWLGGAWLWDVSRPYSCFTNSFRSEGCPECECSVSFLDVVSVGGHKRTGELWKAYA